MQHNSSGSICKNEWQRGGQAGYEPQQDAVYA